MDAGSKERTRHGQLGRDSPHWLKEQDAQTAFACGDVVIRGEKDCKEAKILDGVSALVGVYGV